MSNLSNQHDQSLCDPKSLSQNRLGRGSGIRRGRKPDPDGSEVVSQRRSGSFTMWTMSLRRPRGLITPKAIRSTPQPAQKNSRRIEESPKTPTRHGAEPASTSYAIVTNLSVTGKQRLPHETPGASDRGDGWRDRPDASTSSTG
jgi:hypothetical protein